MEKNRKPYDAELSPVVRNTGLTTDSEMPKNLNGTSSNRMRTISYSTGSNGGSTFEL